MRLAQHQPQIVNRSLQVFENSDVHKLFFELLLVVYQRDVLRQVIEEPIWIGSHITFNVGELVSQVDRFAAKPELPASTAALGEEVHRNDQIERIAKDREILIDFRVIVRQAIAASMVEMPVNAFDVFQPAAAIVLRFDAWQNDIPRFVLIQLVISLAEPVAQEPYDTGPGALGDVGVENWFFRFVVTHFRFRERSKTQILADVVRSA